MTLSRHLKPECISIIDPAGEQGSVTQKNSRPER